jgi:monovalent cation/hydrogen antiporter
LQAAELLLLLLIVVAVLVTIARRARIPYPVLLLVGGLAIGAFPGMPHFDFDPDSILPFVLPPIVYVAAVFTPIRAFKLEIGNIASLAVGLVVVSTVAVAAVALALVPAMTVPVAVALGAIVSPPDAIAATAIASRLAVPRRVIALLEGESLVNDATALTIYRVAIASAITGAAILGLETVGRFLYAAVVGIAVGLAVGWVMAEIRTRLSDMPVEITVSLITPYAAYLPAELLGGSGVLAALATGFYIGRRLPRLASSDVRLANRAVYETAIFLINGFVFILIGIQISSIAARIDPGELSRLAVVGVLVSATLIGVRTAWIFALAGWQRLASPEPRRLRPREAVVLSWAGMRGVVSLAAALAVPLVLPSGAPMPARDDLIVVTFTVILVTLVGQGLTLPPLIKAMRFHADDEHTHEESHARQEVIEEALRQIEQLGVQWPDHQPLIDQLRASYRHRAEHEQDLHDAPGDEAEQELVAHRQIRRAVIDAQRDTLIAMRDRGAIDDDVMRAIERELDLEEVRMEA